MPAALFAPVIALPARAPHPAAPAIAREPSATSPATSASDPSEPSARETIALTALLRRLTPETREASHALVEAALESARGRSGAAVDRLGSARQALGESIERAAELRREQLASRRARLRESGVEVRPVPAPPAAAVRIAPGELGVLVDGLEAADREIARTEADWQALEVAFGDVAALRAIAAENSWPVAGVKDRIGPARERMAKGPATSTDVSQWLGDAREEGQELSRSLAGPLRAELDRVGPHPEAAVQLDPVGVNRLRALREGAERHWASGEILGALRALTELRRLLREEPAAPAETPAGPSAAATPRTSVDLLQAKARRFAEHLRTLPPDSEAARKAALGIREATALLRDGRLAEADATLTRLMQSMHLSEGPT